MPGNYSVPTRAAGSILTATIYNSDHGLHVTYNTPGGCDDASASVAAMQATADPGEVGTESLPTDLLGELQRIRHVLKEISGKTQWYETPSTNLGTLFSKGADIALASTLVPVGDFAFADVTGSGINVLGINTEIAGKRRTFRFLNAVNLIHNGTSFILPFGRIYRTYAGEVVTFLSLGSGNWLMADYTGSHLAPGTELPFNGATAPNGFLLSGAQELNCTTYEGLFTEMVANLDQEGYPAAVGTITADNSNDTITLNSHGLNDGDVVHFANTGGGLPGGISAKTIYYVRDKTTNTFKITATRGGAALDITSNGSGTNSVYKNFKAPDSRGRVDVGLDNLGGTPASRITSASLNGANSTTLRGSGGAQTHTLVIGEMPVHDHPISVGSGISGSTANVGAGPINQSAFSTIEDLSPDAGGGGAHSNTQPWRAVTKIVRV